MISQKQINGEPFVVVETPRWKAEIILSVGSNMLSLIDRNTGLNILREPPSMEALKKQPEIYGLPVLIPPNCIYQGKFSWRGRDYSLPVNNRFGNHIHGVVLHAPWEFLDSSEEEGKAVVRTRCIYDERNPMFAGFPHKMEVVLTYTFLPDCVLQKLSATNLSDSVMPFAAGFHASFRFPLGDRSPEAYRTSSVRVTVADYSGNLIKSYAEPRQEKSCRGMVLIRSARGKSSTVFLCRARHRLWRIRSTASLSSARFWSSRLRVSVSCTNSTGSTIRPLCGTGSATRISSVLSR